MSKTTTKQFIAQAKEIHGERYDYSKIDYITSNQKITIICKEHGEFKQVAITHKNGGGCPICSRNVKLTTEQFIEKAKEVHGERYDYSKVNYKTNSQKVTIICREHGEFNQTPKSHRKGAGCPVCSGNKKLTTKQFIEKAKEAHGNTYDYSNVDYKTSSQKIIINCREHGGFEQTPNSHIGGQGCPVCGGRIKLTTEQFVAQAKEVHGERYDYSKVDYKSSWKKVKIICREHGEFEQAPITHKSGGGCSVCSGKAQLTTEQFIEKAKEVHGERYDYSKVNYKTNSQKVIIICREHGEFAQVAQNHRKGAGCPICSGKAQLTTEQFIEKAKEVHGERYDYSKVDYKTNKQKVTIICKEHGEFEQVAQNHMNGAGCLICSGSEKLTTKKFILQAKEIHRERYDYSQVDYKGIDIKVTIICKKHGEFQQTPYVHKKGSGCPVCGYIHQTTEEVIQDFKMIHGNIYDYAKVDYKNIMTKVTIICKVHGEFHQTPKNHKKGNGCPSCFGNTVQTTEEIIQIFRKIHGDTYDYSKVDYTNSRTAITIICKEHGEFQCIPKDHKKGRRCPSCTNFNSDPYAPSILYYLSINNGEAYKIGITSRSVIERFSASDMLKIKVIYTVQYQHRKDAYSEEQRVLKEFEYAKYTGDNLLESGNTELFNYDVLLRDSII